MTPRSRRWLEYLGLIPNTKIVTYKPVCRCRGSRMGSTT